MSISHPLKYNHLYISLKDFTSIYKDGDDANCSTYAHSSELSYTCPCCLDKRRRAARIKP